MEQRYDFFISHRSVDNHHARALYDLLLAINPEWKIFLDCSDEKPLETSKEWFPAMLKAVEDSRYLIFVVSSPKFMKQGYGRVYQEVLHFMNRQNTRFDQNRGDLNVGYFGIMIGAIDFDKDLYEGETEQKAAEYRALYESPEHLMLPADATVESAKEQIKNKVLELMGKATNAVAAELLDRTAEFARKKAEIDPMFAPGSIIDALVPKLADITNLTGSKKDREAPKNLLDFTALTQLLLQSHIAILGNEGGSGKTSLLTKLFYHYLETADAASDQPDQLIPLYVDAKTLAAENYLILRYLARYLYNEDTVMTDRFTGDTVNKLHREFSRSDRAPRYLLLIDGYNEIPAKSLKTFNEELKDFLPGGKFTNVRVVLSGRYLKQELLGFSKLTLEALEGVAITSYLKVNGLWQGKIEPSLFKILSIPMYLKMYVDTASDDKIHSKGDLLQQFVTRQCEKDMAAATGETEKASYRIYLTHLLPLIAHRMVMTDQTASTYICTESELEEILETVLDRESQLLKSTGYKKYYGVEYREDLKALQAEDAFDLLDPSIKYFVEICKLLRRNEKGECEFIHQIYRDFFCAWFVAEEIKRSVFGDAPCQSLSGALLEDDVRDFVVERLGEGKPFLDPETGCWDYSCNESSHLVALLRLARAHGRQDDACMVANVVELFKRARRNDLSNCDFSLLDLRQSELQTCTFSRYDTKGTYAASFAGATMNRENLFCENHFVAIRAACLNEQWLASVDETGVLKFWEKSPEVAFPKKIITDIDQNVKKLLFAKDGQSLYAMTRHEILELPIPQEFYSKAAPKVLFKTTKRLWDMMYDQQGRLCFTTSFNSYNPKPVTDPDAPDERAFYGLNTAAAIRDDGKQVAFGHVVGYKDLRIYNYCEETGKWVQQKFGYPLLLETYMLKMEDALRKFHLYHRFPDDNVLSGSVAGERRTFFIHVQNQLVDRIHDHEEMMSKVFDRVLKELGKQKIRLFPVQMQAMEAIIAEYEQEIQALRETNPLLLKLSGRRVNSLSYKPGTDLLAVSVANEYDRQVSNYVIELNTRTLETRYVLYTMGNNRVKAEYCDDGIQLTSNYLLTVFDHKGVTLIKMATVPKNVDEFWHVEGSNTFFAASEHFIYEFDHNARCVRSWNSEFSGKIAYCVDGEGKGYLVRRKLFVDEEILKLKALDLSNGHYQMMEKSALTLVGRKKTSIQMGGCGFKMCGQKLVTYEQEIKTDELEICYKLFICGCDFTGVKGELAEPEQQLKLFRFGAVTQPVQRPEYLPTSRTDLPAVHSTTPFVEPDPTTLPQPPFLVRPNTRIRINLLYNDAVGGNNLAKTKTWSLINWGTTNRTVLEAADISILEWVNRLSYATSKMIFELMEAGLVEKPQHYTYAQKKVGDRMASTLHRSFKLLFRYVYEENGVERNLPLYTTSLTYGAPLLRDALDNKIFALKDYNAVPFETAQKTLALNQWFSLTLCRHKDRISRYALNAIFDNERHFHGRGRIDGYIRLGDQAFFAQAFRRSQLIHDRDSLPNKMHRMCMMATDYAQTVCGSLPAEYLTKPPMIVLIGEDMEHCRILNQLTADIMPGIRRLFTYDILLNSDEAFLGDGNYFEFVDGVAYAVNLRDLI